MRHVNGVQQGVGGGENIRFRLELDRPRSHSHIFSDL